MFKSYIGTNEQMSPLQNADGRKRCQGEIYISPRWLRGISKHVMYQSE